MKQSALVLFSGGQDSTTCLAWALDRFDRVETVGFDYRQRNRVELEVRPKRARGAGAGVPASGGASSATTIVLDLAALAEICDSAMTRDVAIATRADGLPNTFVPGRNLVFLTFAAALAYRRGLQRLVTGVCETDYSGYPDCRDDTIKALQVAINLGMATRLRRRDAADVDRQGGDLAARARSRRRDAGRRSSARRPTPATRATAATVTNGAGAAALPGLRVARRRLRRVPRRRLNRAARH